VVVYPPPFQPHWDLFPSSFAQRAPLSFHQIDGDSDKVCLGESAVVCRLYLPTMFLILVYMHSRSHAPGLSGMTTISILVRRCIRRTPLQHAKHLDQRNSPIYQEGF
jgi:hypothetical protein